MMAIDRNRILCWSLIAGGLLSGWVGVTSGYGQTIVDLDAVNGDVRIKGKDGGNPGEYFGSTVKGGDINGDGIVDLVVSAKFADPSGRDNAGRVYVFFGSNSPPSTIDLSSASADMTILGGVANDYLGNNIGIGDVNGDGFDDLALSGGTSATRWYVLFGSSSPSSSVDLNTTSADMTLSSSGGGGNATLADVNGDGFDDLILGLSLADPGGRINAGKAVIVYGKASPSSSVDLDTQADVAILGSAAEDKLGGAIASGDYNGDGLDDIAISANYADPGGRADAGVVYLIFGTTSLSATIDLSTTKADRTILGETAGDRLGTDLSQALAFGDVNGDGREDLLMDAVFADPGGRTSAGKVYVDLGKSSPSDTLDLSSTGAEISVLGDDGGDQLGKGLWSRDINGDGFDDLILGADGADPPGGGTAGETNVIYGSASLSGTKDLNSIAPDLQIRGDNTGDQSGYAVVGGDFNGDGFDDVFIGAFGADPGGRDRAGEAYVIYGPTSETSATRKRLIPAGDASPRTFRTVDLEFDFSAGSDAGTVTAKMFRSDPGGNVSGSLTNVSTRRYWEITTTKTGFTTNITFHYNPSRDYVESEGTLELATRANSSADWEIHTDVTRDPPHNTIRANGVTSFSQWTFGSTGDNSLPVELSAFSAAAGIEQVRLTWRTESEENNAYFRLYRTIKGTEDWIQIAQIAGAGNATTAHEYVYLDRQVAAGVTYAYQLADVDFTGVEERHGIVTATPLAVQVLAVTTFNASSTEFGVQASWSVTDDDAVAGFVLLRQDETAAPFFPLDLAIETAAGPSGIAYTVLDRTVQAGTAYVYRLEALVRTGERYALATAVLTAAHYPYIPEQFALRQNYPNPFNPETTLEYRIAGQNGLQLTRPVAVRLIIYNLHGQPVRMLFGGTRLAGVYQVTWDGRDNQGRSLPSGIYFARLESGHLVITRKMTLLK